MSTENSLHMLEHWVYSKGYHIEYTNGADTGIFEDTRIIEVDSSISTKEQLTRLLHECGHLLIFKNGNIINLKTKDITDKDEFKVIRVIEEAEAWKRGLRLSRKLNLKIDEKDYRKSMIYAMMLYVKWASDAE